MSKKKWFEEDPTMCEHAQSPRHLFKDEHLSKDTQLVRVSEHPYCMSCYSLYLQVCKEVADQFNISLDGKEEWSIEHLHQIVTEYTKRIRVESSMSIDTIDEDIRDIENKMRAVCRCIRARMYHHTICTKPNPSKEIKHHRVNVGNLYSDIYHDILIVQMCYELQQLNERYKVLMQNYNYFYERKGSARYQNKIKKEYGDVYLKCERKLLSVFVTSENVLNKDWLIANREEYVEDKSTSGKKKKKNQSRVESKDKYKPIKQKREIIYEMKGLKRVSSRK
jgi:hypothetical protein